MHMLKSAVISWAALAALASPALAGTLGPFDFSNAPGASVPVAAVSDRVTYAKPGETLKTFVAFNLGSGAYLLKNTSGNTINKVTLTFTASVTDGAEKLLLADTATYLAGLPAGCSYPGTAQNPLVISCELKQFKAGDSFPAFTVFYEAPAKVTQMPPQTPVGDLPDSDLVKLHIGIVYSEGTAGGNPRPNSTFSVPMADSAAVKLGTENPTFVKSAVPKAGTTLFTGVGSAVGAPATADDPWTTTVIVPTNFSALTGNYTVATLAESTTPTALPEGSSFCTSLASNLLNCSATSLTIPGSFAKLVIYLRRDFTTLVFPNRQNDINSAKVYYSDPANPDLRVSYPLEVPSCSDTTYGALPQLGIPCINARKRYPNNAPAAWARDWEFEIFALDNGVYEN